MAEASWFFTIPTLVDEKGMRRPGARRLLRKLGTAACVISLDSRRSAAAAARYLQQAGLEIGENQIYSTAMAAVDYVRHIAPEKKHAACLGSLTVEKRPEIEISA
jgi:ribonucleotide monophosphatase NagD (HAD superfamily)